MTFNPNRAKTQAYGKAGLCHVKRRPKVDDGSASEKKERSTGWMSRPSGGSTEIKAYGRKMKPLSDCSTTWPPSRKDTRQADSHPQEINGKVNSVIMIVASKLTCRLRQPERDF
jgi:hypothetical protein